MSLIGQVSVSSMIGPQGEVGPQGIQGEIGPTGPQGENGIQGVTGEIGATGAQGEIGEIGATGIQGATGPQGSTGPQGVQGVTGLQGEIGPQGVQGVTGPQGIQGIQGVTGSQGVTGPQGIQGTAGAQGIQGTTGVQGVTGPQGIQGVTGPQGVQGTAGALGATGPQGIQGTAGTLGATGPQGIQGTAGALGSTGATGSAGVVSAVGTAAGNYLTWNTTTNLWEKCDPTKLYLGGGSITRGTSSVAIGLQSGAWCNTDSICIGVGASAYGTQAVSIGGGTTYCGVHSVAIGYNSQIADVGYSVVVGYGSGSSNAFDICVGHGATTYQNSGYTTLIGHYTTAYLSSGSTVIGSRISMESCTNCIFLSADGSSASTISGKSNAFFVKPIRSAAGGATTKMLTYDTGTYEVYLNTDKTFVIDHPTRPDHYLVHACLEGPEAGVYYRGQDEVTERCTQISLPPYVDALATDFTVQLTPIAEPNKFPLLSSSLVEDNKFTVYASIPCRFFWTVYGKRNEIQVEVQKSSINVRGDGPYTWFERADRNLTRNDLFSNGQ